MVVRVGSRLRPDPNVRNAPIIPGGIRLTTRTWAAGRMAVIRHGPWLGPHPSTDPTLFLPSREEGWEASPTGVTGKARSLGFGARERWDCRSPSNRPRPPATKCGAKIALRNSGWSPGGPSKTKLRGWDCPRNSGWSTKGCSMISAGPADVAHERRREPTERAGKDTARVARAEGKRDVPSRGPNPEWPVRKPAQEP